MPPSAPSSATYFGERHQRDSLARRRRGPVALPTREFPNFYKALLWLCSREALPRDASGIWQWSFFCPDTHGHLWGSGMGSGERRSIFSLSPGSGPAKHLRMHLSTGAILLISSGLLTHLRTWLVWKKSAQHEAGPSPLSLGMTLRSLSASPFFCLLSGSRRATSLRYQGLGFLSCPCGGWHGGRALQLT